MYFFLLDKAVMEDTVAVGSEFGHTDNKALVLSLGVVESLLLGKEIGPALFT